MPIYFAMGSCCLKKICTDVSFYRKGHDFPSVRVQFPCYTAYLVSLSVAVSALAHLNARGYGYKHARMKRRNSVVAIPCKVL